MNEYRCLIKKRCFYNGMPFLSPPYITIYALAFQIVHIKLLFFLFENKKARIISSLVIYFVYPVVLIGASDLRNSRYLPVASLELLLAL